MTDEKQIKERLKDLEEAIIQGKIKGKTETALRLIQELPAEKLFPPYDKGRNILKTAITTEQNDIALAIIKKEGVTIEHILSSVSMKYLDFLPLSQKEICVAVSEKMKKEIGNYEDMYDKGIEENMDYLSEIRKATRKKDTKDLDQIWDDSDRLWIEREERNKALNSANTPRK